MKGAIPQDVLFVNKSWKTWTNHLTCTHPPLFRKEKRTCESMSELEDAAIDYYANILMPFGKLIKAKIDEIKKLG